MTPTFHRALLC